MCEKCNNKKNYHKDHHKGHYGKGCGCDECKEKCSSLTLADCVVFGEDIKTCLDEDNNHPLIKKKDRLPTVLSKILDKICDMPRNDDDNDTTCDCCCPDFEWLLIENNVAANSSTFSYEIKSNCEELVDISIEVYFNVVPIGGPELPLATIQIPTNITSGTFSMPYAYLSSSIPYRIKMYVVRELGGSPKLCLVDSKTFITE